MSWVIAFHWVVIFLFAMLFRRTSINREVLEIHAKMHTGHNETIKSILSTQDLHQHTHQTLLAMLKDEKA